MLIPCGSHFSYKLSGALNQACQACPGVGNLSDRPQTPAAALFKRSSSAIGVLCCPLKQQHQLPGICVGLLLSVKAKVGNQPSVCRLSSPLRSPLDSMLFLNPAETGVSPLCLWSSPESRSTHEHTLVHTHPLT